MKTRSRRVTAVRIELLAMLAPSRLRLLATYAVVVVATADATNNQEKET